MDGFTKIAAVTTIMGMLFSVSAHAGVPYGKPAAVPPLTPEAAASAAAVAPTQAPVAAPVAAPVSMPSAPPTGTQFRAALKGSTGMYGSVSAGDISGVRDTSCVADPTTPGTFLCSAIVSDPSQNMSPVSGVKVRWNGSAFVIDGPKKAAAAAPSKVAPAAAAPVTSKDPAKASSKASKTKPVPKVDVKTTAAYKANVETLKKVTAIFEGA